MKLRRALAALTQLALVLPFVTVEDCTTHAITGYTGIGMFATNGAVALVVALVLAAVLVVSPAGRDRAVGDSLRAIAAGGGLLGTLASIAVLSFGDTLDFQVGFYVIVGTWSVLWLLFFGSAAPAAAREEGCADRVLLGLVAAFAAFTLVGAVAQGSSPEELLSLVLVLALLLAPLTTLALTLSRRAARSVRAGMAVAALYAVVAVAALLVGIGGAEAWVGFPVVGGTLAVGAAVRVFVGRRGGPGQA